MIPTGAGDACEHCRQRYCVTANQHAACATVATAWWEAYERRYYRDGENFGGEGA